MSQIKWQDFLNLLTLNGLDTGVLKSVKDAAKEDEKFQICYDANKSLLEEWIAEHIQYELKSSVKSAELRSTGNKVYQRRKDLEALKVYNLSVQAAPYNTVEFALALANRSAVLGRLDYKEDAVRDIDLALQHNNKEVPRQKLLIRKAILLYKLSLLKDALLLIKSLFPNEELIRTHENEELRNAYFDALKGSKNAAETSPEKSNQLPLPKGGENKSFSSASKHVCLKFAELKGRHVVANKHLDMADIIFVEKPFALVVLPEHYQQHCHHCCKAIVSHIPCQDCTRALFCSVRCRDLAWTRYHQWECRGLDVCHSIGIAHLGLRVALQADSSDKYQKVFDLTTHIDDMQPEDIYQYTITAALLTLYLEKYTSYFECNSTWDVYQFGARILHHLAQMICNGHAITKIDSTAREEDSSNTTSEANLRIATAIYPSVSMMNHSCDQNISNSFINECLIVRASRPIKKGEEVFNCYGPHYTTMDRDERKKVLRGQYFFMCDCHRCSLSGEDEHLQFSALLCAVCAGPVMKGRAACSHCGRTQLLVDLVNMAIVAQEAFHKGDILFKDGNKESALACFKESVLLASKCLYIHNTDLRIYKDMLARTYSELGKFNESAVLIEECLGSVEKQFGTNSLQMSKELFKLSDVLDLELLRLMKSGKQKSKQYYIKLDRKEKVLKQIKKIIEGNVDAAYLNSMPDMAAVMNSVAAMQTHG